MAVVLKNKNPPFLCQCGHIHRATEVPKRCTGEPRAHNIPQRPPCEACGAVHYRVPKKCAGIIWASANPVVIDGVLYKTATAAASSMGVCRMTIAAAQRRGELRTHDGVTHVVSHYIYDAETKNPDDSEE
jgi:hypothetical protein